MSTVAGLQPFVVRGAQVVTTTVVTAARGNEDPALSATAAGYEAQPELVGMDVRVDASGRVCEIAPDISGLEGEEVIEAAGLVLSPGFIDLHSHSDLYALERDGEQAPLGDQPKLLQGCTAQVFGQDGISAAPVNEEELADFAAMIAGLDGSIPLDSWTWRSFGEYQAALRQVASTRVAGLVGHSTIRRLVMGMENRPPTQQELEKMAALIDQAMREGALGLSSGLVYVPAAYAKTGELVALCEVVARRGGRFFVHVRSESDGVVEATREVLEVARRSGVHLHYSHIKTAGKPNWGHADTMLSLIEEYRQSGVSITADVHPYTAGSTTAAVLLPPWVLEGDMRKAMVRLSVPEVRQRIRSQILTDTKSWDNWWAFSGGWEGLHIADAAREGVAGQSFAQLIKDEGVSDLHSQQAFDVVFDLLGQCDLNVSLISFNNVEENIARFMAQPYTGIGSDALVNPHGHPHPRLYGTFPRVLGRYVRQLHALDLGQAVHSMTSGAASAAGWVGRGVIEVGKPADLVLFDPNNIEDRATYDSPRLSPVGIERVWVGGRAVVVAGKLSQAVPVAETGSASTI